MKMTEEQFRKIFDRVRYFYDIHMNSYHVKIANLACEEYVALLLEIISKGQWELLKTEILNLQNRKFQQRLLTFLTPIDFEFCKSSYKEFLDLKIPEYIESEPYGWRNFTDPSYFEGAKNFLLKISKKRKITIDFL